MKTTREMIAQLKTIDLEDLAAKAVSERVRRWAEDELGVRREMKIDRPLIIEDVLA